MSQTSALSTAQLAIYAAISIPSIYVIFRHGKRGILGWLYLLIFCVLRVTGIGMSLSNPTSSIAILISNIGLSPLLLAMLGIMHEGRAYRMPNVNQKLDIPMIGGLHILVATSVGLTASGATALTAANPDPNSATLVKVGIVTMLLSWVFITMLVVSTLLSPAPIGLESRMVEYRAWRDGTRLIYALLGSIPLAGVRILYSVAANFFQSASLSPITGSLTLRVCLSMVPEMLVVILFVVSGLWTRNIGQKLMQS